MAFEKTKVIKSKAKTKGRPNEFWLRLAAPHYSIGVVRAGSGECPRAQS
jgi:hypothetical protein